MDRLEIMEALKHLPSAIELETNGLSEAALRQRPSEDEWSIKEIVGHLRDYAELTQTRFYVIWSLHDPVLPDLGAAEAAESVRRNNYQDADLQALIDQIRTVRNKTVDLLSHAVDWTRLGQELGVGRRSLKQFAVRAIEYEDAMLARIQALKAEQGLTATV